MFCLHYALHLATGRNLGMGTLTADIRGADMNTAAREKLAVADDPAETG